MSTSKIILGIDPGSRKTGYGLIRKLGNRCEHIENGTLFLEEQDRYLDRLKCLYNSLNDLIKKFQVEILAVEDIFYHKNPKTIQKLGEVRGVVLLCAATSGLSLQEYAPLQVKQAITGYGRADKNQIQVMVGKLLGLRDRVEENAGDALAIALCCAYHQRPLALASSVR